MGLRKKIQYLFNKKYQTLLKKEVEDVVDPTGIPNHIFMEISTRLIEFEANYEFTNCKITLNSLAQKFNTNTSYLSKVININKKMNFRTYLNNIRVDYIIEQLKKDKKLRLYTIDAIAKEAGFKTPESFSKAFFKQTGIYPSYFLKKLSFPN